MPYLLSCAYYTKEREYSHYFSEANRVSCAVARSCIYFTSRAWPCVNNDLLRYYVLRIKTNAFIRHSSTTYQMA